MNKEEKIVKKANVSSRLIEEEIKKSYLDYSMSVIIGRALPDVRDGLKPVHRRILYAMYKLNMLHNKPFKKSARIVGEVLGKYHPHGDMAVYDALVRMAQDFSLRYMLIDGQGNFGSIDGDSPAAMRYTEVRLKETAEEMLKDIEKNVVKFVPNFDNTLKEPNVLPSRFPNLLVNGSSGIAVGMATNIPSHNLREVCDAITKFIENKEISDKELCEIVKGPDFPTGGIIYGKQGIHACYKNGKGKILLRAKTHYEENKIIIDEIPYSVNKAELIKQIASLVRDKKIDVVDIRDESDKKGIRIVLELRKGANQDVILNYLFKHTRLQITYGIILLAIDKKKPRIFSLKGLIESFVNHRKDVITKRIKFDLERAKERLHIVKGLIIAINKIDETIKIIKKSENREKAKKRLVSFFNLSEKQALAILEMKLQQLTSLEQDNLKKEYNELERKIKEFEEILSNEKRIYGIIKKDIKEIKEKYGDERRTTIADSVSEIEEEDMIEEREDVVIITHKGYIKRTSLDEYKKQKRGGKGIIAAGTKEGDFVVKLFVANTHDVVLFFTNKGRVYSLNVYKIPEFSRYSKGSAIVNLLKLNKDEKVATAINVKNFEGYLVIATKKGIVKKLPLEVFSDIRSNGKRAILLKGDELVNVVYSKGNSNILLATKKGKAIKFSEKEIRVMGRNAYGVRGIKLKEGDEVIGMIIAKDEESLLTITKNGYGKRTKITNYPLIHRGGKGVKNIKQSERNGDVISIISLKDENEFITITKKGMLIRIFSKDVAVIGRNTFGVRIIKLKEGDKVIDVSKVVK